jgi:predicted glycosyl hydrolase (DUF1957 family)
MMHSESGQSYAEKRVRDHLENMTKLYHQLTANNVDAEWLGQLRKKNNIFAGMDILEIYETL